MHHLHVQRYCGDLKGFRAVDGLVTIVTGGVPVNAAATGVHLERALMYGYSSSATEHLPEIRNKIEKDVRRQKCLEIQKSSAHEIPNLGLPPLAAVVTHKVRIISDFSFAEESRDKKGGLNRDTYLDTVPQFLCAQALPKFLDELVTLRKVSLEKGY